MVISCGENCVICGQDLGDCLPVDGICAYCRREPATEPPQRGRFIVLEGLDGGGKSTQMKLLREFLLKKGIHRVFTTHEPSDGPIGQAVKAFLRKEYSCAPAVKQLAFTADRGLHLQMEILPRLESGAWVICDRYILSTLVYGASESLSVDLFARLNLGTCGYPNPDLTVLFDLSPQAALSRLPQEEEQREYFEEEEKLARVRELYLNLVELFLPYQVIDAEQDEATVTEQLLHVVNETLFNGVAQCR